ncbi:hypothetical protein ELH42_13215 [Rhizobium ruizarguesonis]|uniref:hypothetical protein n=1 Tax=Rhizobium ruizarguesonis TaxID=2081791 RepID=UPI001030B3AD|nr:hypothetical protein [Rhizobium ruizarguesonis]TBB67058.1 hypothetical protein ELH42_13215 [Rhizobium ruizarguesonis]
MPAISPDALRAARALAGLSEREVEEQSGVSRHSLEACEAGSPVALLTVARLRDFYAVIGIDLLGTIGVNTDFEYMVGARWRLPGEPGRADEGLDPEGVGFAFAAARGLLGWDQKRTAREAKLSHRQIGNLEAGGPSTKKSRDDLRIMFENKGIEFLGDRVNGRFVGVGVRWSSDADPIYLVDILPPDVEAEIIGRA